MDDATSEHHRSRDRAVVRGAGAAVFAKATTAASTVLIFAIAAHNLPAGALGVVAVLTTMGVYTNMGDFGLGIRLLTLLPEANARGAVDEMRDIISTTMGTLTMIGLVVAGVGTASAYIAPWPSLLGAEGLDTGDVRISVVVFFVCTGLSIPACVIGRVLAALLRSSTLYLWTSAGGVLSLLAVIASAAWDAPQWAYVGAIIGIPVVVALALTGWSFTRIFPELRPPVEAVPLRSARSLLRSSAPYAVINISTFVAYCIDSVVISAVMGAKAAGTYALAARLFTLVGGTLLLAGQQMWSALADAMSRGDTAWVRSRFKQTLVIFTAINAAGCVGLVVTGRGISRVWLGHGLVPPLSLLVMLGLWTVYSTSMMQASYLLIAMGRINVLALASALMAPLNLGLSIAFTRSQGYIGPTLGSIIALTCTVAIPIVAVIRQYFRSSGELVASPA